MLPWFPSFPRGLCGQFYFAKVQRLHLPGKYFGVQTGMLNDVITLWAFRMPENHSPSERDHSNEDFKDSADDRPVTLEVGVSGR